MMLDAWRGLTWAVPLLSMIDAEMIPQGRLALA